MVGFSLNWLCPGSSWAYRDPVRFGFSRLDDWREPVESARNSLPVAPLLHVWQLVPIAGNDRAGHLGLLIVADLRFTATTVVMLKGMFLIARMIVAISRFLQMPD